MVLLTGAVVLLQARPAAMESDDDGWLKFSLNEIGSPGMEMAELLLRGANVALSWTVLATSSLSAVDDYDGDSYGRLLVSSKAVIVFLWLGLLAAFVFPLQQGQSASSTSAASPARARLSALLYIPAVGNSSSAFNRFAYGLLLLLGCLDLGLAKLLPWTR